MKASLKFDKNMRFIGYNDQGMPTVFDSHDEGADNTAPTPMEIMLQAAAACSSMDVVSILRKKRKTISALEVEMDAERAEEYPKIFTKVNFHFILTSPDAEEAELERAIQLSQEKYCNVSITMNKAGAEITWTKEIKRA